jgi:hypothetical protein
VSPGNVSDAMQAAPNDREDASERDPMLK